MKYTKFTIKNFKGIKDDVEIDLTKLPTSNIFTLVGLNESGKTSILESINLLQNKVPDADAHSMIHKSLKGNFNGTISVTAQLGLDSTDESKIGKFCLDELGFTLTKSINSLKLEKQYSFKNSKFENFKSLWTLPLVGKTKRGKTEVSLVQKDKAGWSKVINFIEEKFPKILYYENFLFDFPKKIYLSSFENETKEEVEYRKIFQDILDSFDGNLTIQEHLISRLENTTPENQESLEAILGDVSQKLTEVIFSSWGEIFSKSNKEIEIKTHKDEVKGYYLELKIKQGKDRFYIDERSLGFRWFFSFLLFTEFRKERKEDFGETLFLLDEPASNLHQKSQQKLLGIFEKLSTKCKIIYSTHSHHLINTKYLAGTYIIKNKAINYDNVENFDQNETEITATLYKHFASKYPDEKDHFKPILDAIEYTPSDFELVEKIVCLEGKNDYYTFKYFQEVVFNNKYGLHFYPGSGVSKYDDLFRLYLAWNKDLLAVFDSDTQGKKEQKRYIQQISSELSQSVFTLEDVKTSWKNRTTESLFIQTDKVKIMQSLFPEEKTYNKSKFNTALEDIFINKKSLKLAKQTKENFEAVFKFMEGKVNAK